MHSSLKRKVDLILGKEVLFESFSVGFWGKMTLFTDRNELVISLLRIFFPKLNKEDMPMV